MCLVRDGKLGRVGCDIEESVGVDQAKQAPDLHQVAYGLTHGSDGITNPGQLTSIHHH